MFQINTQTISVPKVVVSEIFGVSRSAVTQTCKKRSVSEDFVIRSYNKLMNSSDNAAALKLHIDKIAYYLLQDVRASLSKRSKGTKKVGRPLSGINFTELKRIIRAIVADILHTKIDSSAVVVNESVLEEKKGWITGVDMSPLPTEQDLMDHEMGVEEEHYGIESAYFLKDMKDTQFIIFAGYQIFKPELEYFKKITKFTGNDYKLASSMSKKFSSDKYRLQFNEDFRNKDIK